VHSGSSGPQNVDTLSYSGWPDANTQIPEKSAETCYAELVFLHLV
jgi:hypothetical protein